MINSSHHDFSDLDFDLEPHREAIAALVGAGFNDDTIRASLKARDLIHVRMRGSPFVIGLATDLTQAGECLPDQRCIAREVIYESRDSHAAQQVRREVESYFLRHFPGRCCAMPQIGDSGMTAEAFVYVALFAPVS
jgi:hypothetical protein